MQDITSTQQTAEQFLIELVTKQLPLARAVAVATEFNVAHRLRNSPKTSAELALELEVNENGLYRLLRFLSDFDIFNECAERCFENTVTSELMRPDVSHSLRAMILWDAGLPTWRSLEGLDYSVRTGLPYAEQVFGMPFFEYLEHNPQHKDHLYEALDLFSKMTIPAVISAYDFSVFTKIVDLGGGKGDLLRAIETRYKPAQLVLFDREEVVNNVTLPKKIELRSGSFFEDNLPRADGVILKLILHDWNDADCLHILANCRNAIQDQGRLIIIEPATIAGSPHAPFSHMLDLDMMILTGGKERSADEFGILLEQSGFELTNIIATESPLFIIEARPI